LQRRVPKFGFRSPNRVAYKVINLDALEELAAKNAGKDIDITLLMEKGFARKNDVVKILGRGELKAKVNVKVHAFSSTASKAIEAAGGTATTL